MRTVVVLCSAVPVVTGPQATRGSSPTAVSVRVASPIGVIDTEEKIRRVLPVLQEMVSEGLVAMSDVEILHHISGKKDMEK